MKILREILKRAGALFVCAALAQWVLLPSSCPCQWENEIPAPAKISAQLDSSLLDGGGVMQAATHGGPRELCCCADGHHSPFQATSSELLPTPVPMAATMAQECLAMGLPETNFDRRSLSGTDPPGSPGMRLHLRWQVFLI